jgi:hypothetical protein
MWFLKLLLAAGCMLGAVSPASAFTTLPGHAVFTAGALDIEATLTQAPRWSAAPGHELEDGIQVNVAAGFAAAFGRGAADTQLLENAVVDAFAEWEAAQPALDFDITLGGAGPTEVMVQAISETDPIAMGNPFTGLASPFWVQRHDRVLTDGTLLGGRTIYGGNIYIVVERANRLIDALIELELIGPGDAGLHLQQLMMHEIGHILGFGHPNESIVQNMDTDADPTTTIPANLGPPWSEISHTRSIGQSIMHGGMVVILNDPTLWPDDLSGLNVLYPVPEPNTALLLAALATCVARHRGSVPRPE